MEFVDVDMSLEKFLRMIERAIIEEAIDNAINFKEAAKVLRIKRGKLVYRRKILGITTKPKGILSITDKPKCVGCECK